MAVVSILKSLGGARAEERAAGGTLDRIRILDQFEQAGIGWIWASDAEGRLILADALALADEESPDLIVDMATLTGAARVALGPDLPPLYSTDDDLASALMAAGAAADDPLWRLPLWTPYESMISSRIADVNNAGQGGFAGSITAALFLRRFVKQAKAWAHLDIFAWAPEARPGRPFGGTDQGIRAVYGALKQRYS